MDAFQLTASYLSTWAPLEALVADRITADVAREGTLLPLVVYTVTDQESINALDNSGIRQCRVSVQAWANQRSEVEGVLDECVAAFAAQGVPLEARNGFFDEESGLHGGSVEFDLWVE